MNLRLVWLVIYQLCFRTAVQKLSGHQDYFQQPGARAAGQRDRQHRWLSVEGVRHGA
jgi:hypothetical protein